MRLEVVETWHAGHAASLAREAAQQTIDQAVAAGGDGTVVGIASGLDGSDVPLGIIPPGTANVLAHELSLPIDVAAPACCLPAAAPCRSGRDRATVRAAVCSGRCSAWASTPTWCTGSCGRRIGRSAGGAYVLQTLRELPR